MTRLVDQAIEAIRKLPQGTQDELARFVLTVAGDVPVPLTPDEAAAIAEAEAQIARGEGVTADRMDAFWRKHGV